MSAGKALINRRNREHREKNLKIEGKFEKIGDKEAKITPIECGYRPHGVINRENRGQRKERKIKKRAVERGKFHTYTNSNQLVI
jgi:hypothetical protein